MSTWLLTLIPYLKAVHISMIAVWTAGLFALPMMMARHENAVGQADFSRIRQATHRSYTLLVTPAAVIAIATGTVLIFLSEAFTLWMFAKLVCVALMVAFHAWIGGTLVEVAETEGSHAPPAPVLPLVLVMVPILGVLTFVLAKPDLSGVPVPDWLTRPVGVHLPLDVPR